MTPKIITVHCSASPNGKAIHGDDIKRWHKERGFTDIGYHAVIELDGGYFRGRPENTPGAHVEGHNIGNLGVCLIGLDKFTAKQFETLRWCLEAWMAAYNIPIDKIFCHYEWDTALKQGKTCPNIPIGTIRKWLKLRDDKLLEPYLLK